MKKERTVFSAGFCAVLGTLLVAGLTLLDQGAKFLALTYLKGQADISLLPGVLELRYLENRGMAFGLFEGRILAFVLLCIVFFWRFCMCTEKYRRRRIICR